MRYATMGGIRVAFYLCSGKTLADVYKTAHLEEKQWKLQHIATRFS